MAQLSVSTSDPADGATDVFVNNPLDVTFDAAVLETSVSATSVVLVDVSTDDIVSTDVSLVTTTLIRISPLGVLAEDTLYRIQFPGTDVALSSNHVLKDDAASEALTTTIEITFRTGSRVFIDDTAVDKDATDLSLEGDLNLPIHVKALGDFAILSTTPKNHTADVSPSLGGTNKVVITFNDFLDDSLFTPAWLDIDVFPVLDDTYWLSSGNGFAGTGNTVTIPGYSAGITGADLEVTFSGDLPYNTVVQVRVDDNVTDDDGQEFGPNDFLYSIGIDRSPKVAGIHIVKQEIRSATDELTDDYIAGVLFAKTVDFNTKYDISSSPHLSVHKWILNSAIVDILDDKELEKALAAGTRRQLGDLNVSVDVIIGRLSLKHARALKKIEEADKTLLKDRAIAQVYQNLNFDGVTRNTRTWTGVSGRILSSRFINFQADQPASNTLLNRRSKIPPGGPWGPPLW
jgi:hypothetical protein